MCFLSHIFGMLMRQKLSPAMAYASFSFILIIFLLPFYVFAQNNGTVAIGSTLTATATSKPWVSPSDYFAFGFRKIQDKDLFLLAIWYAKIPDQTIVWFNNTIGPVPQGSTVALGRSGLVLRNPQGELVWQTENITANHGFMNDTGNFILMGKNNFKLWESFQFPADTLLPFQELLPGSELISRRSETNFSKGRFHLRLPGNGDLVLTIDDYSVVVKNGLASDDRVVFQESGSLQILTRNNETTEIKQSSLPPVSENYFRATLNFDGVFTLHYHPRTFSGTPNWTAVWWLPDDICYNPGTDRGSGVCGNNKVCKLGDFGRPICECPQGYQLEDPNDKYKRCIGNFTSGSCGHDEQASAEDLYGLVELRGINFPQGDSKNFQTSNATECKESCLGDCYCAAAVFGGDKCWKKKLPLSNGRKEAGCITFLKYKKSVPKKGKAWIWAVVSLSILAALLLGLLCYLNIRRRRLEEKEQKKIDEFVKQLTASDSFNNAEIMEKSARDAPDLKVFSFGAIAAATDNFSSENKLGQGGFGPVYMGKLPDGRKIAVKRLSKASGQGLEELKNELILISKLQHTNLVRVLGCCILEEEKMLIYEFMPNKSLDFFLFDQDKKERLDWPMRFNIIEGVAQGLLYLHKYSRMRVIHRDLKASNVLLDENMNPKIADFGMARIFKQNETEAITNKVVGTYGYMSPEYAMEGTFSIKSDVFSFGVLILEIVSGRKNSSFYQLDRPLNLVGYAWELWKQGMALELKDPTLGESCEIKQLLRTIQVGLLCVQESATDRPTIPEVVSMLNNETMTLPNPKQPAFFTGRKTHEVSSTETNSRQHSEKNLSVPANDLTISVMEPR